MKVVLFFLSCWPASFSMSTCSVHQRETYAVQSHTVGLHCAREVEDDEESSFTFSWTKDTHSVKTSPRIKVQNSSLWILSTELSDSGLYVCNSSNGSDQKETRVLLSVEESLCPRVQEDPELVLERTDINLTCTEEPIQTLGQILQMQWRKNCESEGVTGSEISLHNVSSSANYTCLTIFSHEGQNYTFSHTIQLLVMKREPMEKPEVKHPRNQTLHISPGEKTTLECTVFIGLGKQAVEETMVYWTVNDEFTKTYPQLQENLTLETRMDNRIYGTSRLLISEVLPEFFDVPFRCIALSTRGTDVGVVWLSKYDKIIQTPLIITLVFITVIVMSFVLFMVFKIDIILAYRHLCSKDKTSPRDEKIYNAYVSHCCGNSSGSTVAENLALKILPEVLEQQHNLKLFIHGRDDTETEVNIADVTDVVSQCRTVLLILPESHAVREEAEETCIPLSSGQEQLESSHSRELYSVITQSSVPVILLNTAHSSAYSLLPESVQAIVPENKVLSWKPTPLPNSRFWKHLRYRMT